MANPEPASDAATMNRVPLVRLYALRAVYLLIALFLLSSAAPNLTQLRAHADDGRCAGGAIGVGAGPLLGLRYPLQLLPLMLFELSWKLIWLVAYGLPLWSAGALGADNAQTFHRAVAIGVPIVLLVLPWRHLWDNYIARAAGHRWR